MATAIWSTTPVVTGYLITRFHMPPLVLSFWRDLIVAIALFAVLSLVARPLLRLERRQVLFFLLYGFVLAAFNGLWITAVALNGAAVATVLAYSAPAFTALAGWRLWGERLDALKIGAVVLCIVGCALISGAYDGAAWRVNPVGIVTGLASGVAFATYNLLGKVSSRRGINPWTATLYSFGFAAVFLLLVQRPETVLWLSRSPGNEALQGWGILVFLAAGPTLTGYGLYTVSLTHLPATTASLITTLEPALTAVQAFCFLGERLTIPQLLGGGLILVGVVLVRLGERGGAAELSTL
jgi:drug/metabolite transporter (DMT)-like permease